MDSTADSVTVTASTSNSAPVANAGADQNVSTGSTVTLDGTGSTDADGDTLTYSWTLVSKPPGSTATLSFANVAYTIFTADVDGSYVASLVVNDGTVDSTADSVTVTAATSNSAPVANAGADQNVSKDSFVILDGSGSSDADGDMLTYSWSFTSVPSGSAITDAYLSDTTAVRPAFVPDVYGSYVISLVVNDGTASSAADTVTLTAESPMALIPAGCFDMGDAFSEGVLDELPVHNVCVSGFYMDEHEVTNAEYKACVDDGGCTAPSSNRSNTRTTSPFYYGNATYDNFPVMYVNWYKATAYCTWAGKRLPTEAEWEYAARGGLSGKRYPNGDTISCVDANYAGCVGDTSEVESYAPNGYGLYDMAGNVREWANDWYDSGYYSVSPTNDPQGPATGSYCVLRGGGWCCGTVLLRVADRYSYNPSLDGYNIGFRCARD
jgi:formylglycine-generating enzyme required for sulfatase activity